jgi:hypothetical protein
VKQSEHLRAFSIVDPESDGEVELGGGFWIVKRNEWLLSGRSFHRELLSKREYDDQAGYVHYLVYKRAASPDEPRVATISTFENGYETTTTTHG